MYLKAFIQNFVKNGPVVSKESKFYFSYVNDLGPWSRNDLDLQYLHTFINNKMSASTNFQVTAIVSENPLFSLFPTEKPK